MDNRPSYEELEKRIKYLEQKILKEKDKQSKKRKLAINIGKRGIYLIAGKGLKNAFKNIIEDYQKNKSISSENLSNLFTHLVWRFTRIGIFTVFIAALPSIFLVIQSCLLTSQNKKIDKQNELIEKQNKFIDSQTKRLDQQTYLQESSRRSSSMFLFSNIMNKIDEELKIKENLKRHLSNELIASIISLSHSLKPYKYLKNDKLSEYISPERGQLLTFLINARLSSENYSNILKEGDFTFSEIKNIEFKNINLNEVNLEGSSIENVKFIDCSILNLNLFNTKVKDLNFEHCNIIEFRSKYSSQKNIKLLNSNISVLSYDNCFVNSFILKNSFIKNFKALETNILGCIFKKNVFNYFIYEDLNTILITLKKI